MMLSKSKSEKVIHHEFSLREVGQIILGRARAPACLPHRSADLRSWQQSSNVAVSEMKTIRTEVDRGVLY